MRWFLRSDMGRGYNWMRWFYGLFSGLYYGPTVFAKDSTRYGVYGETV